MKTKNAARPKIVVVDDEPDFLKLVESWLSPAFDVTVLVGPDGASEEIRALEPDLILLDVHMPEESGFKICRQVRSMPGFEDLPIVFLTGSKTDEDFLFHLETGGTRYLTKPIGRKTLLEALAEQLGHRQSA
jgi:chemotaxis family two-component system response regulator PixG